MIVSILGCGWLGFPLAQTLLRQDYIVKGSTTTKEKYEILKKNGIEPYILSIPETVGSSENESFWDSDILFLNIPPGRGTPNVESAYPDKIRSVCEQISSSNGKNNIKKLIFASSTSVYPAKEGVFSEDDADLSDTARPSGTAVLKAEQLLMEASEFETVVLRFGGLYGYNRHPVRYLAGKINLSSPLKPVNLIHQDDCIQIIKKIIDDNISSGIYNAVSDGHPPRKTFYQSAAKHFDLEPPTFDETSNSENRIISNKKLKKELSYSFIYPNPLDHTA
ncbi:SDR family oxidoreductase [Rhodohalobacter sp. 8-1]|uniref:SDR family oxidoreductase n=1 Tax=Rhodohalobacter sp. 8-1 TaxID=3131972 RepID=UPI0030EF2D68